MAEDLCISNGSKEEKYRTLLPQIKCLIADENDLIANLANVAAALKETFGPCHSEHSDQMLHRDSCHRYLGR